MALANLLEAAANGAVGLGQMRLFGPHLPCILGALPAQGQAVRNNDNEQER